MTVLAPVARRISLGRLSVCIALWLFVGMTIFVIGFYQIPQKPPSKAYEVASSVFVAALFVVAPLGHLVGFVLGIVALFRAGDRHGMGALGIALNSVVVVFGIFLVYMALSGLAPR
jgi:TRAP-type C4-dicarboxylate transport system permease small subunit